MSALDERAVRINRTIEAVVVRCSHLHAPPMDDDVRRALYWLEVAGYDVTCATFPYRGTA